MEFFGKNIDFFCNILYNNFICFYQQDIIVSCVGLDNSMVENNSFP